MILACLTEDVRWEMPPYFELSGRTAFDDAIENDASPGLPDIQLTRLVEEGDIVVAEGAVQAALKAGGRIDALFCDVFHFREDKIWRLVTYQVDRRAGEPSAAHNHDETVQGILRDGDQPAVAGTPAITAAGRS